MKIAYMAVKAFENKLEKGQDVGDATKVITSNEIGAIDGNIPTIESEIKTHVVRDDGKRISNGKESTLTKSKSNIRDARRKQLLEIEEQEGKEKSTMEQEDR